MNNQQPKHVFISYVRENQKQVDRLCQDLESHGVKVWLDRKSIKPGDRWKDAIREAIRHGDFFIACFSKEYTSREKNFMNEELTLAIEELRQFASDREWFIPVLMSECDVPARSIGAGETLRDINWVPLYKHWNDGIKRILSVIKPIPIEQQNLANAISLDRLKLRKVGFEPFQSLLYERHVSEDLRDQIQEAGKQARYGLDVKESVSFLINALKHENEDVRETTIMALGEIGPEAKDAVPVLIKALKDEDMNVRWRAAMALGEIGPEAKDAVPVLIKALKDEDMNVRWQSAKSVENIGHEAVPSLINALKDENKRVRRYAAGALEKINTPEAQKALEEYKQKSN